MMIEFQIFSILCWNIRGAISLKGKLYTRDLVKKYKPSMVILVETHCAFSRVEKFWQKMGYDVSGFSEAQGHIGGIRVLVEKGINFMVSVVDNFHQAVTVSISRGANKWTCSAIYASPVPVSREILWDHLQSLRSLSNDPWLLFGDFNEILLPSEVSGGQFSSSRAAKFSHAMDDCDLLDLGDKGHQFTWFRKAVGDRPISKRLDRALYDSEWRIQFPETYVENLVRHHSDHCLMLLRCTTPIPNKHERPFRFQAAWLHQLLSNLHG